MRYGLSSDHKIGKVTRAKETLVTEKRGVRRLCAPTFFFFFLSATRFIASPTTAFRLHGTFIVARRSLLFGSLAPCQAEYDRNTEGKQVERSTT
jgi:hypothetical protein